MKYIVGVSRIFVGILFIISGLIKLNDPVGFSFKLQDYFAPDVLNLEFLVPYSLMIALFVVVYEVMLGIMLILGYAKKFTLWSLLAMIIFFTFLTFYSAYFNKVTDCGCFGDALKLTPWESFWKDIVLLVLILVIFLGKKHLVPFFTANVRSIVVMISFVLCLWLGYHVLMHLPIVDFRAYKIGNNITEKMTVPEDALPPIIEYQWVYELNGKETVIKNTNGIDPKPEGGKRIEVKTHFIREPYEPPIHDFTIERDGEDFTEAFLAEEKLIVVIAYNLDNTEIEGYANIKKVTDEALKKGYKVIGLSASSTAESEDLARKQKLNFQFYFCDMTTLKTIVRSNPGILELSKGTILQKEHWNDTEDFKIK
ncbi:MAG: DoxX family protein [Flavobacteriaceae bacterium]